MNLSCIICVSTNEPGRSLHKLMKLNSVEILVENCQKFSMCKRFQCYPTESNSGMICGLLTWQERSPSPFVRAPCITQNFNSK